MDHDFHQLLMDYVGQLSLNVSIQKLLQCQAKSRQWLTDYDKRTKDDAERSPKVFVHLFPFQGNYIPRGMHSQTSPGKRKQHSINGNFYGNPLECLSLEVLSTV